MRSGETAWQLKVPKDWDIVRLGTCFDEIRQAITDEVGIVTVFRDGEVTLRTKRRADGYTEATDYSLYKLIQPGDLGIHNMDAFAGAIGVSDSEGMCSPVVTICRPKENVNAKYMALVLREMARAGWIEANAKSVRERTSEFRWPTAKVQEVPLPTRETQDAIISFLDRELTQIDELIVKQEQLVELETRRRRTLIQTCVQIGMDGSKTKVTGVSYVPEIKSSWSITMLKRLATFGSGVGFPEDFQGETENEIPFLKVNALGQADQSGYLRVRTDTVSSATALRLRAQVFPADSLVMAKIGAALLLGRVGVLSEPSCIDNNMMVIRPRVGQHPRFMFYQLQTVIFDIFVNPGAVPSTSGSSLGKYVVAEVPLSQQIQIANFLDQELTKIDNLISGSQRVRSLLQERRQSLITAAVTGKINVRKAV